MKLYILYILQCAHTKCAANRRGIAFTTLRLQLFRSTRVMRYAFISFTRGLPCISSPLAMANLTMINQHHSIIRKTVRVHMADVGTVNNLCSQRIAYYSFLLKSLKWNHWCVNALPRWLNTNSEISIQYDISSKIFKKVIIFNCLVRLRYQTVSFFEKTFLTIRNFKTHHRWYYSRGADFLSFFRDWVWE